MTPLELALTRDEIRLAFAVEIQWPEITARFHTGVGDLVINVEEITSIKPRTYWTEEYGVWSRISTSSWAGLHITDAIERGNNLSVEVEVISGTPSVYYRNAANTGNAAIRLFPGKNVVKVPITNPSGVWIDQSGGVIVVKNIKVFRTETFTGVGSLGEISTIKENSASSPSKVDITLTGFDDSLRGEVLRARYHGRPVTIWLAALDDDWQTEAAEVVFKGKITDSKVKVGEKNSIKITASNRFEDWDKKRADRFNDESQNARHPGDRALKYVCDTSKREITFAGKTTDFDLKA